MALFSRLASDCKAESMQIRDRIYINGRWVPPQSTRTIDVINAATEAVLGRYGLEEFLEVKTMQPAQ